jgi:hypothetical protein
VSSIYPAGYPIVDDWNAYTAALLPDIAANGDGLAFFRILVDPMRLLDDEVARLFAGLVEIEDAEGPTLDLLGDQVGESRRGLSDTLYRRIIAGRRVARAGGVTRPRVYAGWAALTGSSSATMEELGTSSLRLVAPIDFTPTDIWLTRAGSVVRDLIGAGYEATALVTVSSTSRFADGATPWGVGQWAYQLRTLGAS